MQTKVVISNEILNWLTENVQTDSLPKQIQEYLYLWKAGKKTPTFNQIEKTSKATGIPLGYFFLQTPPTEDESLADYRTVDSVEFNKPSRNLLDVIHDMELIQEWTRNHLISEGYSPIPFVGAFKQQNNVLDFAVSVRQILDLSNNWFSSFKHTEDSFNFIRTTISNSGVVVMMSGIVGNNTHRSLDINEFRAFTLIDDYAPLIFINSNDSINARLFSLLHEFAHICIGENSLFNDRYSTGSKVKKAETVCNAVAAEILVPQQLFSEEWTNIIKYMNAEQAIPVLARNFKCGSTVIARKALDNKFIDYQLYEKIAQLAIKQYNNHLKKQKEKGETSGDYYKTAANRIDKRFFSMLVNSVAERNTLYTDAFRLTNTNRVTFLKLAKKLGGNVNLFTHSR